MARQDMLISMCPFPMTPPENVDIDILNVYAGRPMRSQAPFSRRYAEHRLNLIGKQVYNLLLQIKASSKLTGDQ